MPGDILYMSSVPFPIRWRHNERDDVSNYQPHDCLLNRLFGHRSKKTSKLRVTGLWAGNSPGTGEFPAQMARNAENVSIWWRHHDICSLYSSIVQMPHQQGGRTSYFSIHKTPVFMVYGTSLHQQNMQPVGKHGKAKNRISNIFPLPLIINLIKSLMSIIYILN